MYDAPFVEARLCYRWNVTLLQPLEVAYNAQVYDRNTRRHLDGKNSVPTDSGTATTPTPAIT